MNALRDLFPNTLYIARREYKTRVQGRAFLVSTVFLAVLALAVTLAPVVIKYFSEGAQTKIGLVAATANVPDSAATVIEHSLIATSSGPGDSSGGVKPWVVTLQPDLASAESARAEGKLNGVLVICRADANGAVPAACGAASADGASIEPNELVFVYRADTMAYGRDVVLVRQASTALAQQDRFARAGIDSTSQAKLFGGADFAFANPKNATSQAGGSASTTSSPSVEDEVGRILTATALIVLIFIVIIGYGNWVAISVAEEKNSRVMELMLNAAKPDQMLAGKVIGNGFAGFTQYLAVLIGGGVGLLVQGRVADLLLGEGGSGSLPVTGLSLGVLLAFGVFFVLGFALYAILYAAAGSMVSRQEDVQQAAMPLMMVCMVGYFAATLGLQAIDAPWVTVMSFVPFFSPYLMLARLMLTTVAPWEILLCVALLIVTILGALWVASRIYRAGVLLYGQRVGFRTMVAVARRG